jgi:type IV pilus assembly protein PilY1
VSTCDGSNYWNCDRTKDSWRTILIGGMRLGGGCKAKVCSGNGTTKCASDADCAAAGGTCGNTDSGTIGTPLLDPADATKGLGYSSYFALDITDNLSDSTEPPRLLWEFSDEKLGLSSSGPAIVRIKALKDPADPSQGPDPTPGSKDGRWFVVLGSGPTGPISDRQFLGVSDQNLSLIVLDLKTGARLRTITMDGTNGTPNIPYAFSGSLLNANFDSDLDYQDDVIYSGYVKRCTDATHPCALGQWTDGGVGRLVTGDNTHHTKETLDQSQRLDPNNWKFSVVKDGTGPVTTAVVKLQDNLNKKLWVYFGAGRYYFKTSTAADDNDQTRTLYGIKEPCFDTADALSHFDFSCTDSAGLMTDVTSTAAGANGNQNWKIDMASAASPLGAERLITDPLATSTGLVFFTSFAPYSDICTLGGNSYIWAVKYDTGGAPGALLKGKALVQVSTGKIEQVDLSTQFTDAGGRRTAGMEGVPPTAQGLSIISSPAPIKRVLHMKER